MHLWKKHDVYRATYTLGTSSLCYWCNNFIMTSAQRTGCQTLEQTKYFWLWYRYTGSYWSALHWASTLTGNRNQISQIGVRAWIGNCPHVKQWLNSTVVYLNRPCSRARTGNHITLQCDAVITRSILSKYSQKTPHSSPYGASFVDSASDWYSASVPAMMYAISCYIWPRYNGTRLYFMTKCFPTVQRRLFDTYTSLAMGQWYCRSANEDTPMNMGKCIIQIYLDIWSNYNKVKQDKTICLFYGIYVLHARDPSSGWMH